MRKKSKTAVDENGADSPGARIFKFDFVQHQK